MKPIYPDNRIIDVCRVKKLTRIKNTPEELTHLSPFLLPGCWIVYFPGSVWKLSIIGERLFKDRTIGDAAKQMKT